MIVLNLKTYEASIHKPLYFVDVASEVVAETGVRIIVCPPALALHDAAERFSGIFAQHTDPESPGAYTGSVNAEMLKTAKVKGSLVNHSERRVPHDRIKTTIERLHSNNLESIVCAESPKESAELALFSPGFIAVEPPELIGSGVSVSKAKPDVIKQTVRMVQEANSKVPVLCGAGVGDKHDVEKALELGACGVLLASAFVKAKDPKRFLSDLASAF